MSEEQSNAIAQAEERKKGELACIIISVAAIALNFVPYGWYVLYPFSMIYTFVHEMGHGLMAQLVGGEFVNFVMYANGSGVAKTMISSSRIDGALVAFGGLVAPAIWAAIFLLLGKSKKASAIGLFGISLLCILSLIIYVRSLFGFFFVGALAAIAFGIGYISLVVKNGKLVEIKSYPQYTMLILAMTLCTCVFTRGDYLFTPVANTSAGNMPSDVANIAKNLFLPYWFWGGLIAIISVAVLAVGIWAFFKPAQSNQKQIEK